MSGGHYNYDQHRLRDIADTMRCDLKRIGTQNEWESAPYGLDESTQRTLRLAIALLEATADIVHDIDWCLSGDTGEDTLRRDMHKWSMKHELAIERAIDAAVEMAER